MSSSPVGAGSGLLSGLAIGGAILLLTFVGYALARLPRRLIVVDLETAHGPRSEAALAAGLAVVGLVCALTLGASAGLLGRTVLGATASTLAAVVYYDLRFLVIPDLCTLALALAAVAGPLALPLHDAVFAAAVCAALIGGVAWLWRLRTGTDGLGFGDVKLSAALGGLLGLEAGLWMITVAAFLGAVLGYAVQVLSRAERDGPTVVPFGAALSLVGGGFLLWAHR